MSITGVNSTGQSTFFPSLRNRPGSVDSSASANFAQTFANSMMKNNDKNGDGYVTRSEMVQSMVESNKNSPNPVSPEQAAQQAGALFDKLDQQGTGRLSQQQFTAGVSATFNPTVHRLG